MACPQVPRCKRWKACIWGALLMLQSLIALASAAHSGQGGHSHHKCVHDTHVVPHVSHWSSRERVDSGVSDASRRQLLTTSLVPLPIRITPVYQLDDLDNIRRSFLSNVLVPAATRYLQRLYKVKYPVTGPLLLKRSCVQVLTGQWSNGTTVSACSQWAPLTCLESALSPSHFDGYTTCDSYSVCSLTPAGTGIADTDFVLYVTAKNTTACQTGTIAYASFCTQDDATDRPTSGSANFCPDQINPTSNWAFQLDTAVHELTHALGFSAALFKYYRDDNNVPLVPRNADGSVPEQPDLSGVIGTFSERGTTATKLITPKATQAARDQFGCATLNGAELENDGGSGTAGSHWEERVFLGELMTAVTQSRPVYSRITAAALEDSGWYVPTYDVTQPLLWGQGRGCAFPLASCAPGGLVPVDPAFTGFYCGSSFRSWTGTDGSISPVEHMCTDDSAAVGFCQPCNMTDGTCFTDGCMPIKPLTNYACTNASLASDSDATNSSSLAFWGQTFGVGSKCISDGSQAWSKNGFERPPVGGGCFQYQCIWDVTGTQATLTVMVGGRPVTCVDGQEVSLTAAGFDSGTIGPCPIADDFCNHAGCVNDCSNQGICVYGACVCLIGWAGTDCSQLQCSDGLCPPDYTCDPISGVCLTGAALPSPSPSASSATSHPPAPSFSHIPSPSWSPSPFPGSSPSKLPPSPSPSPSLQASPSARPLTAPSAVSGIIYDGYFANCTLCMDANSNRRCDAGEATAISNATGGFEFQKVTAQSYGPVLLRLGDLSCVDVLTNLSPTTVMVAPLGSSVVSPLTTLLQALMDVGQMFESQAESTVKAALELPLTAQITSGDPIQGVLRGVSGSLEMLKAVAYLTNVAAQFDSLLSGASEPRPPPANGAFSLSVYRAMATYLLENQTFRSPAKASRVPSSAEMVPMSSSADASPSTGLCSGFTDSPLSSLRKATNCSVGLTAHSLSADELEANMESTSSHRVVPRKAAERATLADVSVPPLLNLTDLSTLHGVLDLAVSDALASGALPPDADVSADVASSVVSLAANTNALVAAVGPGNATQTLQTLSQIGVTARGSVLGSIQELSAGNITVATFTANSAPERLALIAANTAVAGVNTPLTSAPPPAPIAAPPPPSPTATVTVLKTAGNGVYLIGGLLLGLFLVLGGAIGFIFWRWRKMQTEGGKSARNAEVVRGMKSSKKLRSKRGSKRVTGEVEGESISERMGSEEEDGERKGRSEDETDRYESGTDRNGTENESVVSDQDASVTQSESEQEGRGRRHRRSTRRQHKKDGDGSESEEADGRKHFRKAPTRGRPRLETGRRSSAGESEGEDLDKALVLNRGSSTAIAHPRAAHKPPPNPEREPSSSQNGSYIYAPQQIIIINRGNSSEDDNRAPRPQNPGHSSRFGPRHVPQIAATNTATLALEAAPSGDDVGPYVTVPSEEGDSAYGFSVTEVRDSESDGKSDKASPRLDAKLLGHGQDKVRVTSLPVNESFSPTEDGLLVSSSSSPVNESPPRVKQTSMPVNESFTPRQDGAPIGKASSSSRTTQPVQESFFIMESEAQDSVQAARPTEQHRPVAEDVPERERPVVSSPVLVPNPAFRPGLSKKAARSPQPSTSKNDDGTTDSQAANPSSPRGQHPQGLEEGRAGSPVRRVVPQKGGQAPTGEGSTKPEPVAVKRVAERRPGSAPNRPAGETAPSAASRPRSALLPHEEVIPDFAKQSDPQRAPPRAPSKQAWEASHMAGSQELRPGQATGAREREVKEKDGDGAARPNPQPTRRPNVEVTWPKSQAINPYPEVTWPEVQATVPYLEATRPNPEGAGTNAGPKPTSASPQKSWNAAQTLPAGKRVTGAPPVRAAPSMATTSFTFDVETPGGQQSRAPTETKTMRPVAADRAPKPPNPPNPPNPSADAGFAKVSLALLKKGAPSDGNRQLTSKGRQQPKEGQGRVLTRQASVEAPATVLSATRSMSPEKLGGKASGKIASSPRMKTPTGGEAGSADGSDHTARDSARPTPDPGRAKETRQNVGPSGPQTTAGMKAKPGGTREVVVDLRKGAKQ